MLCAGEDHLLSNTTILQNLTKPKGPHTFSGRNSLLMFSWNESTPLSPAPYWCSITWTSLEYSSKTWGLEVSPHIPARRNIMHCLCLFVWPCYQLLWRITFCWPCSLCFHNLQGYGLALNSRYGYRWQGKDPFHLNASNIRWNGQMLQSLAAMICTVTCSKSTCQHASASWQTWFFLNRSGSKTHCNWIRAKSCNKAACNVTVSMWHFTRCNEASDDHPRPWFTINSINSTGQQNANQNLAHHIKRWIFPLAQVKNMFIIQNMLIFTAANINLLSLFLPCLVCILTSSTQSCPQDICFGPSPFTSR